MRALDNNSRSSRAIVIALAIAQLVRLPLGAQAPAGAAKPALRADVAIERDVAIPMRDGVVLRADVWRPRTSGRFPVLVYRTPYGKVEAESTYATFTKALARGYAVVMQDVRGRYASDGEFVAYQQEGRDGYDTIEWAATQPWSNGAVGTFGLSYPGAVQWLAAIESPPHLRAMVPAMTFATPHQFFYAGGVWDNSWLSWVWDNVAPDARKRKGLVALPDGDGTDAKRMQAFLPLSELPELKAIAPWYYEWLRHPPYDPWWEWAELRGKYGRTGAAVLNLSGWYDEAYGPHGATTNFTGLTTARAGTASRTHLVIGPWPHGVGGTGRAKVGDRPLGDASRMDYDETVLRWMDRWLRDVDNGVERESKVRVYVMGDERWRTGDQWPLPGVHAETLYLAGARAGTRSGSLQRAGGNARAGLRSTFVSDPMHPVTDPYAERSGAHDYRAFVDRPDVLTFETAPLEQDIEVIGAIAAEIYLSTDARDTDLWVRVQDVSPDGTAWNLMYPGSDVIRASYRDRVPERALLDTGRVYLLKIPGMLTGNTFKRGHRVRVQLSTTFFPYFSRNLHTGASEAESADARTARITIYHDSSHPSRIILPVMEKPGVRR